MNGAGLRHMLQELEPRLTDLVDFVYPDAPNTASAESVQGIASLMGGFRAKPPNLEWWNASADGRTYHGWTASLDRLRSELARAERTGVLGFSQGAGVAAALAALSQAGVLPPLAFVVLVAGFPPRADELAAHFQTPIALPSLHVWDDADSFAKHSPLLLSRFDAATREKLASHGRHSVPTEPPEADAIVDFIRRHAS
jgi:fermentation-respiration switch protein FrsA (DUF1100 family)